MFSSLHYSNIIFWKFIPNCKHSPHLGGLWEAAVKSFKSHLKKVLKEAKLNFEEFSTIIALVEVGLKSRTATPPSEASDTNEVLTPGHFLIGKPLATYPEMSGDEEMGSLKQWHLCQSLMCHIWSRWSQEYKLSHINRFSKWHADSVMQPWYPTNKEKTLQSQHMERSQFIK